MQQMFPKSTIRELKEMYLPIDDLVFDDCKSTTAGYVDNVLITECTTYAEMSDWKFGYWQVESADNNLQAVSYMLGLFKLFPKLQKIRFFFKLPNIDGFTETEMTRDQIPQWYLRIQVAVARARAARKAGDYKAAVATSPLCSFCANLGDCPVVAALMINVAHKYWPLSVPADITPTALLDSKDTNMCLRLSATGKSWCESFRARITDRVLRGAMPVPDDHHIESRKGNRKVADPEKFKATTLGYITEEEYNKLTEPPAFGAVETVISDKAPRGSKESTVKQYAKDLETTGAVERGEPYSFLKATNNKEKNRAEQQKQNTQNI